MITSPPLQLFWLSLLVSLSINAFFFIFAVSRKTDKVTDLSYSLTFLFISIYYLIRSPAYSFLSILPAIMVIIWSLRLGIYLFVRIQKIKKDDRFDHMREKPLRFAGFWSLQACTVWIVLWPVSIYYAQLFRARFTVFTLLGLILWLGGIIIEAVSDYQKYTFKLQSKNRERWISHGLWRYSRHPNFFGEMMLWWGIFIYTLPVLSGWFWLGMAGPLFITFLLRFVSGIPLLEKKAHARHGDNADYQAYITSTNLIFPWFPKTAKGK